MDRSAAYMGRYIAKNIVAAGLADQCLVQLAYAIGVAEPMSVFVNTYDTGRIEDEKIADAVKKLFKPTPQGIVTSLDLLRPIYKNTATYGHFGRDGFPWEKLDKVEQLKSELL